MSSAGENPYLIPIPFLYISQTMIEKYFTYALFAPVQSITTEPHVRLVMVKCLGSKYVHTLGSELKKAHYFRLNTHFEKHSSIKVQCTARMSYVCSSSKSKHLADSQTGLYSSQRLLALGIYGVAKREDELSASQQTTALPTEHRHSLIFSRQYVTRELPNLVCTCSRLKLASCMAM